VNKPRGLVRHRSLQGRPPAVLWLAAPSQKLVLITAGCGEYGDQATGPPCFDLLLCCLSEWMPMSPRGASESLPGVAGATRILLYADAASPVKRSRWQQLSMQRAGGVCLHHAFAICCSSVVAGLDMMHACVVGPVVSHLYVVGLSTPYQQAGKVAKRSSQNTYVYMCSVCYTVNSTTATCLQPPPQRTLTHLRLTLLQVTLTKHASRCNGNLPAQS
jgi:hypothetical protein